MVFDILEQVMAGSLDEDEFEAHWAEQSEVRLLRNKELSNLKSTIDTGFHTFDADNGWLAK